MPGKKKNKVPPREPRVKGWEIVKGVKGFDCPVCGGARTVKVSISSDKATVVCSSCGTKREYRRRGPAFMEVDYYTMFVDETTHK